MMFDNVVATPVTSLNRLRAFPSALFNAVNESAIVGVTLSNSFWICGATFCSAAMIFSAVSSPSLPIRMSSPIGTPMPSASAFASFGVCSSTEFSSSPRSTPDAMPCPNCTRADAAESARAPESAIARAIVFWSSAACAALMPS